MIYTRFGTPVEIVSTELTEDEGMFVTCRYLQSVGTVIEREWPLYELRADGGLREIMDAITQANGEQK